MEQVKQFARERFFQLLLMLVVAIGAGLYLSFLTPWFANASVSNVELEDNDNQGYGFDGRDFSVSWAVQQDPPAGYQQTKVYIVPSDLNLTTGTLNTACNNAGGQCISLCNFNQYNQTNCGLPPFINADSNNTGFATSTEYVAWVFVSSTNSVLVSSTPFQGQFDTPEDDNAPFIDHVSASAAIAGQDALFYAFIFDDQTTAAAFDNLADGEAEFGLLYYGQDVSVDYSTTTLNQVQENLFVFTIPAIDVPAAGQSFEYYIEAGDRAGNIGFIAAAEDVDSMDEAEASPFVVNVMNSGVRTVTGGLTNLDNFSINGRVFPAGLAVGAVQTQDGEFTISNLPNNVGFEAVATAPNHCDDSRPVVIHTENVIDVNFRLREGQCGFEGGEGGDPQVMFSGPPQGARGVPPGETIRIGFNQVMAANTINSNNPEANDSAIYLTADGGQTRLAGQVIWCENSMSAGCQNIPQQDNNVILFNPTNDLEESTQYALVIDESVTAENGRCIQGNREGCGFVLNFLTGGENVGNNENFEFGGNGQFMPPFVRAMIPGPGFRAAPNTNILLEFNQPMDGDTIIADNIQLRCEDENVNATLSLDNTEQRMVTINPSENLQTGECIVNVRGAVASAEGIALRPEQEAQQNAFHAFFEVSGNADEAPPTIFPLIQDASSGVAVNTKFEFGLSELPLPTSVLNASNITFKRGNTSVSKSIEFDPAGNRLLVIPDAALNPNTLYTIRFTTSVTDLAGNALEQAQTFTYTTGGVDASAPTLSEVRCDDFQCRARFSEPMNHKTQIDGPTPFGVSVLNHENITLTINGGADAVTAQTNMNWDAMHDELIIEGLGLNPDEVVGDDFTLTVGVAAEDISGNAIDADERSAQGEIEDARQNFGAFGDAGMFGPPGGAGEEHRPEGFGAFSAEQFAFGGAAIAFPFNQVAGQDADVFHIEFKPDVIIQDGDQFVFTFPNGTVVTDAMVDAQSPFFRDMNEFGPGTISFDTDFGGDGIQVDAANRKVTVQVNVTGDSPTVSDRFIVDVRKIINSPIPKGPESGGSTVDIKVMRAGQAIVNKTTMPFFTTQAGSRSIVIGVFAGSQAEPVAGANGTVSIFVGGPNGHPLHKEATLTNGVISAIDGTGTTTLRLTQLSDGCYFIGTEPFITLGGNDYFGKDRPETVCVDGNNAAATQNIVLAAASGDGAVTTTIQFADGVNFNGEDIDIFAGGPGRFVVKTIEDVNDPGTYTLRLPKDGSWFIGFGPAHAKSSAGAIPRPLPCMAPPPVDVRVSGVGGEGGAVSAGSQVPPGVTFNDNTDTITFSCTTADKAVSGRVLDGDGNGLANVEVFMHTQGFGAPIFGSTNASGTFNLAVAEFGSYEIGAFKAGLPPVFRNIEIRPDGNDVGNDPDIYFKGAQITGGNPLVLQMKKGGLTISGKMFDGSNNPIVGAPIFAVNSSTKEFIPGGMTGGGGAYTVFVSAGTWVIRAELPPDKSDSCGTFSRTVTISQETGDQANQNLTPSASTCYTLAGSVDVGGEAQGNSPIFIEAWDTDNDEPAGGFFRMVSTNENGAYTAKVPGNTTYRVGTFDPDFGELSITQAVAAADVDNADITSGDVGTITFQFTGGSVDMDAFIEVKKTNDRHTRFSKPVTGLDANTTVSVKEGTYDYFVDVFGFGKFTGTVQTGNTATINVGGSDFITVSGNVKDDDNAEGNDLPGGLVTFRDDNGLVRTAVTDEDGDYSLDLKAGTWDISFNQSGFISTATSNVAFAADTANFDIGGVAGDVDPPTRAPYTISGTLYESDGSTPMTKGFVEAQNTAGKVVATPVDATDGTYSLAVVDGTWTIRAQGSRHAKTTRGSTVTISGASQANINLTLDADATRESKSSSGSIAADSGGAVDDTDNSGVRLVAGAGVLESGDGDVTVSVERDYTAPTTEGFDPLGDASFEISASGDSTIKNLNGNAEIVIDFTDLLDELAEGADEGDLQLMYYSPERDEYVPVEGGFVVDEDNNTITGLVDHFTAFVVGLPNDNSENNENNDNQNNNQGGGGGGFTPRNNATQQTGVNPPAVPATATKISQQTVAQEYTVNSPVSVQIGASHHTVTVLSAVESQATIKVQSEPITVTVLKNEAKDVDTDKDGVVDLKVQYTGLKDGKAQVTMVNLTDSGETANAVTINAGAYQTTSRTVTLKFNVPTAKEFAVSNTSDFTGVVFHTYVPTTTWTLSTGDGQKTVYVRFRSAEGGTSDVNDTITLAGQGFVQQPVLTPTPTAVQCDLTMGKAYKEAGSKAVWYITSQCTKRPFNNPRVFFTYFSSWSEVQTTTKELLAKIPTDGLGFMPWGPSYDPQYGALVKIVNDPKVYLLLGTKRHWITSESVFTALKYAWNWIEDISEDLLVKYESAGEITSTTEHPAYTLIKYKNSTKVYRLEPDANNTGRVMKRHVKDEATFESLDYRWDRVVTVDDSEQYTDGDQIEYSKKIYIRAK